VFTRNVACERNIIFTYRFISSAELHLGASLAQAVSWKTADLTLECKGLLPCRNKIFFCLLSRAPNPALGPVQGALESKSNCLDVALNILHGVVSWQSCLYAFFPPYEFVACRGQIYLVDSGFCTKVPIWAKYPRNLQLYYGTGISYNSPAPPSPPPRIKFLQCYIRIFCLYMLYSGTRASLSFIKR
jgi:hypothetical protein